MEQRQTLTYRLPADYEMYIGGEWLPAASGERLESVDPATEEVIGSFPAASEEDVERAVRAGEAAYPDWNAKPATARAEFLRELAGRLGRHELQLAELDARDSGNPLRAMLDDVRGASQQVEMFAGLATELRGSTARSGSSPFSYSLREPYGVVGRIIPFNHPLKFAAVKVAAPLLAGNVVVLKPAETTSLSALYMMELVADVFPRGVLQIVTGRGPDAGHVLSAHPRVPRIAFTGGVKTGASVVHAGADSIKHVSLELGGKNPMIVCQDVDVEEAAEAAVRGTNIARTQGQSCMSNSRIFVHRAIYEDFVACMAARVRSLKVGSPLDWSTEVGPLAYREHFRRVLTYIEHGKQEGARLVVGGDQPVSPGFFVSPTLLADVTSDMSIAQDEIFGPVVSVLEWVDFDKMMEQANNSIYGLAANVWTDDLRRAHEAAHRIECGWVWIKGRGNRIPGVPFGGFKQSGLGQENSLEEVLSYTREKVVQVTI